MQNKIEILRQLGSKIRSARMNKQLKIETLAKMVSLSKSEISRIENGKREPKIEKLLEIAKVLEIKIDSLFQD